MNDEKGDAFLKLKEKYTSGLILHKHNSADFSEVTTNLYQYEKSLSSL